MTAEIVIEKNVPMPVQQFSECGPLKSAMKKMDVGDSFLVHQSDKAKWSSTSAYMYQVAKDIGIKVSIRQVGETSKRVWRTA